MSSPDAIPARPIRVLYVHHAGAFGGASRSLIELIRALPPGTVDACAIVPRGRVKALLEEAGVEVMEVGGIAQFDCTRYGHYRGLRWLILLRELAFLPPTIAAMLKARKRWPDIEIVHLNDTTLTPAALAARVIFDAAVVVHARSVLAGSTTPWRTRWLGRFLARRADAVVAIDETVRRSLPAGVCAEVVHNGFAPGLEPAPPGPAPLPPMPAGALKVAMVGSLLPMKGVYDFVEAARMIVERGLDVHFLLVGEEIRRVRGMRGWVLRTLGFARPVRAEMEARIARSGLGDRVHFVGFTTEIRAIYDAIDVICFPSHLNAPGRPVFEAAFSAVPGIVAVTDPSPDTLVDGHTGIAIPERDPAALADAIERLYRDPELLATMGANARRLALEHYDVRRNAVLMLTVYQRARARAALPDLACERP